MDFFSKIGLYKKNTTLSDPNSLLDLFELLRMSVIRQKQIPICR